MLGDLWPWTRDRPPSACRLQAVLIPPLRDGVEGVNITRVRPCSARPHPVARLTHPPNTNHPPPTHQVRTHRAAYRVRRAEAPIPVIALVGYTNAGKSTLLNTLTHAGCVSLGG